VTESGTRVIALVPAWHTQALACAVCVRPTDERRSAPGIHLVVLVLVSS
jgi:hypothetical protein